MYRINSSFICEWKENECNLMSKEKNQPVLITLSLSLSLKRNQSNLITSFLGQKRKKKMCSNFLIRFYLTEYTEYAEWRMFLYRTFFLEPMKKKTENNRHEKTPFNIDASGRMDFIYYNVILWQMLCCVFSFEFTSIVRFTNIKANIFCMSEQRALTDSNIFQ